MQFKGRKGCLKVARQLTTLDTAYPHTVLYACTHAGLKFRDQARGSSRTSFACPGLGGDWGTDRDRALPPCALPAAARAARAHIRLRVSAGRQSDACK